MLIRWLIATLHLLALPLGMTGIWMRGSALQSLPQTGDPSGVFRADNAWGAAAALWLVTGLLRAFGGLEKGAAYYLTSHAFWAKMGLFALVFALEIWPMVSLIQWRVRARRAETPDFGRAGAFAAISRVQAALLVLIVLAATAMARGLAL